MPGSTAETRYGRQGGGWLPPTAPATTTKPANLSGACAVCGKSFRHSGTRAPAICGLFPCRVAHDWTPEMWDGLARVARARQDAGVPLTDLDRRALTRETPS